MCQWWYIGDPRDSVLGATLDLRDSVSMVVHWTRGIVYIGPCTTEALQIKGTACGVFSIFPCINPLMLVQLKCI